MPSRQLSAVWSRYVVQAADHAARVAAAPPSAAQEQRLLTLAAHLPLACRPLLVDELCLALRLRPRWDQPDEPEPPAPPVSRQRFGLHGEELLALAAHDLRQRLRRELREALRTLTAPEDALCRTTRNWWLAMHCARIGQLYHEVARPWRDLYADLELLAAVSAL